MNLIITLRLLHLPHYLTCAQPEDVADMTLTDVSSKLRVDKCISFSVFSFFYIVAGADNEQCGRHDTLQLSGPLGYIASSVTLESNLGSHRCPWIISALPGQRINITLLTFNLPQGHHSLTSSHCKLYARVRDITGGSDVNICKSRSRERTVFVSETNRIQLEVAVNPRDKEADNFILVYQGQGHHSKIK